MWRCKTSRSWLGYEAPLKLACFSLPVILFLACFSHSPKADQSQAFLSWYSGCLLYSAARGMLARSGTTLVDNALVFHPNSQNLRVVLFFFFWRASSYFALWKVTACGWHTALGRVRLYRWRALCLVFPRPTAVQETFSVVVAGKRRPARLDKNYTNSGANLSFGTEKN